MRRPLGAALLLLLLTVSMASGGTITLPYSFSPNTSIQSAQVNSNFTTVYNAVNGNLDDGNISALSEGKVTFSSTGHDHSSGTKGALVAFPTINGRLQFVSTTQIKLCPFQGNRLYIKKSGVWTATTISSSCITANNTSIFIDGTGGSNLAAGTTYYVYLFDNSGTTTVDYSTTTHATDATTGMEIKSGVDTRVLVGMVRTNGSSQFADAATQRFVLSYFARRDLGTVNFFTANRSTGSASFVELNSEIRVEVLTWADETVHIAFGGGGNNSGSNATETSVGFDGTTAEEISSMYALASATGNAPVAGTLFKNGLSEGYHYATLLGRASAGTATWFGGATSGARTMLTARVRG